MLFCVITGLIELSRSVAGGGGGASSSSSVCLFVVANQ